MITNTKDIEAVRRCSKCNVVLTDDNQYPSMRKQKSLVCKKCHDAQTKKRRDENIEDVRRKAHDTYINRLDEPMRSGKTCRLCGVPLTDDNIYRSNKAKGDYLCKACVDARGEKYAKAHPEAHRESVLKWNRNNREKLKEISRKWAKTHPEKMHESCIRYQRKKGMKPMGESRECGIFLGVYIAERLLANVFKNVTRMPFGNVGYDFICSNNKKIDVKSSCFHKNGGWSFHIDKNKIADYFVCLAFDNRDDLNPLHMWIFPGRIVNERGTMHILPTNIHKWDEYERSIEKVVTCCDAMR